MHSTDDPAPRDPSRALRARDAGLHRMRRVRHTLIAVTCALVLAFGALAAHVSSAKQQTAEVSTGHTSGSSADDSTTSGSSGSTSSRAKTSSSSKKKKSSSSAAPQTTSQTPAVTSGGS